ncbi:hypothetical protein ScPMuIL_011954 [Solemya velum]
MNTQQSFTIIDVCANKTLFETFISEWKNQRLFALSVACHRKVQEKKVCGTIGHNFTKVHPAFDKSMTEHGFPVDESDVSVVGLAVTWEDRDVYYIALTTDNTHLSHDELDDSLSPPPLDPNLPVDSRLTSLRSVLEHGDQTVTVYDLKAQYSVLVRGCGLALKGHFQDPKIANWMMDPTAKEKNLFGMVLNFLPDQVHMLEDLQGGVGYGSLALNPRNPGSGRYRAATECVLTRFLMVHFSQHLEKDGLHTAFQQVEMPSVVSLVRMELNGFGFSLDECEAQKSSMMSLLSSIEEAAYSLAGHPFSLTSTDDISTVLYLELKLPVNGDPSHGAVKLNKPTSSVKKGKFKSPFSTSKDVLEKLRTFHPLPGLILEWRKISAAISKVVFPLQKGRVLCPPLNMSRIFGECQLHTATGRVSMSEPNLQNIPKDFEINLPDIGTRDGSEFHFTDKMKAGAVSMRHVFIPFEGGLMVAADYSQLELRMIAHLSGDSKLRRILNQDGDVFKLIASQWKNVSPDAITTEERQQAKQVCYGMLYGIGPKALGQQLGVDEDVAGQFIETFKSKYTDMRTYLRKTVQFCKDTGYVKTILGRRRYIPAIKDTNTYARAQAERQAINTTIQGSAADLVKKAMVNIDRKICARFPDSEYTHKHRNKTGDASSGTPRGAYLTLQLHDELMYEVSGPEVKAVAQIIKQEMEHAMELSVRMPVKVKCGGSWGRMDDLCL